MTEKTSGYASGASASASASPGASASASPASGASASASPGASASPASGASASASPGASASPASGASASGASGRLYLEGSPALFYAFGEVSSVMDLGWELLRGGLFPPFSSMTALSQTQGRGRHGRVWQSPPGNLYASLRLPEKPPYRGTIAPLALTFELSAALEDLSGVETFIKWPNDLIFSGKKAGGVLLENRGGNVIAGIGLNLLKAPEVERDPAAPKPGALPLTDPPEALWLDLSKRLHLRYNRLNGASGAFREDSYLKSLERRLHRLGEPALLKDARTAAGEAFPELRGIILGLDISGALLLEIPSGVVALTGGSLLMKEPDPSGSLHP